MGACRKQSRTAKRTSAHLTIRVELWFQSRFKRDLKLASRRRKDLSKLWRVVQDLQAGEDLDARYGAHLLSGNWQGHWECRIEPDWLLIWQEHNAGLAFVRTGTHSDLFR